MTQQKDYGSKQARFQLYSTEYAKFLGNHERISNKLEMVTFWLVLWLYYTTLWESQTLDSDCSPFLQEEDINTVYSAVAPIRLYDIQ